MCAVLGFETEHKNVTLKPLGATGYYVSSESVSFVQAWSYCDNNGLKFMHLSTALENARVVQYFDDVGVTKSTSFWVGGIYLQSSLVSKWRWASGDDFIYTNWYTTSLVTGDNCIRWDYTASTTTNGKWYPTSCALKFKFICEN